MIGRIESLVRKGRRLVSRTAWAARFLRPPGEVEGGTMPGLILIQVDGLSRAELRRAMEKGRMPFLSRLKGREAYRLRSIYAGMPSCTPAAQAELFYGVKGAVPAFEFFDRESDRMARMYEPDTVSRVERKLEGLGAPLLAGGSVHGDIFTGGALEGRFCVSAWGWRGWKGRAKAVPLVLFLTNILLPFRLLGLAVIELGLAFYDLVRGVTNGHDFFHELKFVASRVGVAILLREFCVMGAKVDIARGLPSIHVNFFAYDEQAHRRGPSSAFARWSLKGIDGAIRRVWQAARLSTGRSYDVWIYSDHGQVSSTRFSQEKKRSIQEAVAEALNGDGAGLRHSFAAGGCNAQFLQRRRIFSEEGGPPHPVLASMGPVGHLYLPVCPAAGWEALARALVEKAEVPLVMARGPDGTARAWTAEGAFSLPADAASILGGDHLFLGAVARDLAALCHHPNAGELVLFGWRKEGKCLSFTEENGAHGGPSPRETEAFLLSPVDAPLPLPQEGPLRLWHIRQAALSFMGRPVEGDGPPRPPRPFRRRRLLRVMTYNVHGCAGMDGWISPERIARVVARLSPDIVALQELDAHRHRSRREDQAALVARSLGMSHVYHPTVTWEEEKYGDAVLCRLPMTLRRAASLPGLPGQEPRGALWTSVDFGGTQVQVLNTHLGLLARERRLQTDALLGPDWLNSAPGARTILCGDFNAGPRSPICRRLGAQLRDAQTELAGRRPRATWFGRWPLGRIDHIFVGEGLEVVDVRVPDTELDKTASDHLPLVVDLRLR